MKPIIQTSNTSNTAHVKISVAKITPTITFTTRDSVDTPPAITPYVMSLAPFLKNCNNIRTHAITAKAYVNHFTIIMPEKPAPLWVLEAAPVKGKEHGRIYLECDNVNRKDKPTFRHDSTYLFDILSEDYSA